MRGAALPHAYRRDISSSSSLESQYELILGSIAEGIMGLDRQGNIVFANPSAAEMTGYSVEEMVGKHAHSLMHYARADGSDYPEDECPSALSIRTGKRRERRGDVYWRKDGSSFPVEYATNPLIINGSVEGAVIAFKDITKRIEWERALGESEALFRSLVEASPGIVLGLKPDGEIFEFNREAELLYGVSREEAIGTNYHQRFLPPEVRQAVIEDSQNVLGGIPTRGFENPVTTAAGENRVVIWGANRLIGANDETFGLILIGQDITGRKKAEEALRESEYRYSTIFNNNHAVMLVIDPRSGDIVDANPAACNFYGYPLEAIKSLKITDINLLTPDDVFHEMDAAAAEGRNYFVFRHKRSDGSVVDVEVYSGPVTIKGRHLLYSIVHDITARKLAEEALHRAQESAFRLAEESRLLLEASQVMTGSLNLRDTLDKLVAIGYRLVGVERCTILLHHEEEGEELIASNDPTVKSDSTRLTGSLPRAASQVITGMQASPPSFLEFSPPSIESALVVPLRVSSESAGVILFDNPDIDLGFDDRQIRMGEGIGSQATVAIRNAMAYETKSNIAEVLQRSLLPKPIDVTKGLDVGLKYRSATRGALLGGDFFDYFSLDDGRFVAVIGDVSGKGLSAAIDTAMVKYAVSSLATVMPEPSQVVPAVNRVVASRIAKGRFITMLYMLIEPDTGMVTIASAGHPPPVLMRSAGGCEIVGADNFPGVALGIVEDAEYSALNLTLQDGDSILMYTDGLTEARSASNRSDMYGEGRILDFLSKPGSAEPAAIVDRLYGDVDRFSGGHLDDDLAIMAVRSKGPYL